MSTIIGSVKQSVFLSSKGYFTNNFYHVNENKIKSNQLMSSLINCVEYNWHFQKRLLLPYFRSVHISRIPSGNQGFLNLRIYQEVEKKKLDLDIVTSPGKRIGLGSVGWWGLRSRKCRGKIITNKKIIASVYLGFIHRSSLVDHFYSSLAAHQVWSSLSRTLSPITRGRSRSSLALGEHLQFRSSSLPHSN